MSTAHPTHMAATLPDSRPVAVLGLGLIGSVWARHLAADGLDVRAWNRTPKGGMPGFRARIEDAVAGADVVIVVVADPPAVQAVIDRALPAMARGALLVQSSTISAAWTLRFAEQARGHGIAWLDAPFTGSRPAAEARQTVFYLGGDGAVIDRARPVLSRLAKALLPIGPLGAGSSLKLAMNLNIAVVAQALCESLALARAAGIDDGVYFQALRLNASHSPLADLKEPKLRAADWRAQFSVKHMHKDLGLALETAGDSDLPMTRRVAAIYAAGMVAGMGDDDFIGLARLLHGRA